MIVDAPFPYFGGKRRVAPEVWSRFGDVACYVEPFFGSGAVLLGRPTPARRETVNDIDGFVANFWRAVQAAPDDVAVAANNPVNENDLHARHAWLVSQRGSLRAQLEGDPEFFDPRIAGWWVWGLSCWIGGGFCSGNGPWHVVDGQLVHLSNDGRGVNRKRVHLSNDGQGVNRQLVHLGSDGRGVVAWFRALSDRLARVRVCSGDWSRICGPSITASGSLTGVFLDPPYADTAGRDESLYAEDSLTVAHDVRAWAIAHGDDPMIRIALCGYEGEHEMPASWSVHAWKAHGGYEGRSDNPSGNCMRERIWFSPHCLAAKQGSLF